MLDFSFLKKNYRYVARKLINRGFRIDISMLASLEEKRKNLQIFTQKLQQKRNKKSKEISIAKSLGKNIEFMKKNIVNINILLEKKRKELKIILNKIKNILLILPNIPHFSVPIGKSKQENQVLKLWGNIPNFNFKIKSHEEIGIDLGQINFDLSSKITGSRFIVMKSNIARLHRALIQFMLDIHTVEHGYQEIYVPYIVNKESLFCSGQLPKFSRDLFKLDNNYYLSPTSEIQVTNIVRNTILYEHELPIRYVCHSTCFRKEAGSYGKRNKGLIRQHQFEKVELIWISSPEYSYQALEQLTLHAEKILQKLELPYRVVNLCTGDIGFSASKTYDIEVWFPSFNDYKEVSSCSNTESFQSRRMKTKYISTNNKKNSFVHILNGSGIAVGRTLAAIIENFQDSYGNVNIPNVLQPYLCNLKSIKSDIKY